MAVSREAQQVPQNPCAAENNRPSDTQSMDVFDGMDDVVRRQVTERLQPAHPLQMRTLDMNCHLHASHPRRKPVSCNLRTADNTAVSHVTWPHKLIYSPSRQPAVYETISTMSFANGYIEVLNLSEPGYQCAYVVSWWMGRHMDGSW